MREQEHAWEPYRPAMVMILAVALELEVNPETGRVRVVRAAAAIDSGEAVNPDGIRNQTEGGILQSISWTLYEAVTFERHANHQRRLGELSDPAVPAACRTASRFT